jgi:SAM-dependent methyltransferase
MSQPVPEPNVVRKLTYDVYPSLAYLAALELDIFTPLKDGPLDAAGIAQRIQVDPRRIRNLLYSLVETGLLLLDGDRFSNSAEAQHYLVRGQPRYVGGSYEQYKLVWRLALDHTVDSIRTGVPQSRWMDLSSENKAMWLRGLRSQNDITALELTRRWDFSEYRTFADVAGGAGELSIALTRELPALRATIFEHPETVPITQSLVANAGASDRVSVVTADVIDGHLDGVFDAAAMRYFLQMLPAESAIRAIRNAVSILRPGGALYVCDLILDDSRTSPRDIVRVGVVFLNIFDSEEIFAESDYRRWMTEAGLVDIERVATAMGQSIVRGVKPLR